MYEDEKEEAIGEEENYEGEENNMMKENPSLSFGEYNSNSYSNFTTPV